MANGAICSGKLHTCLAQSAKRAHQAPNAVSQYSLHYSLVNLNVPASINGAHWLYWNNCRGNRAWMQP